MYGTPPSGDSAPYWPYCTPLPVELAAKKTKSDVVLQHFDVHEPARRRQQNRRRRAAAVMGKYQFRAHAYRPSVYEFDERGGERHGYVACVCNHSKHILSVRVDELAELMDRLYCVFAIVCDIYIMSW